MSVFIFPTLAGSQMEVERTPYYGTVIQTEASGRELTLTQQVAPRYRYRISYDFLRQDSGGDEASTLLSFLAAMRGSYDTFLFLDPYDSTVTAQEFGAGDATEDTFQLQRHIGGTVTDFLGTWPAYTWSRTNLILRSEEFDNASWTKSDTTVDDNATISPDGVGVTADKLQESATTALHYISQSVTTTATTYTFSVYVKAAERDDVAISLGGSGAAEFNLALGTCTAGTIASVGNGWYRCAVSYACSAGSTGAAIYLSTGSYGSYAGTAGNGLYIWGAQVEMGTTATRYFATTSAAVTQRPTWWSTGGGEGWEPIYAPAWASVSITNAGVASTAWAPGTAGQIVFGSAPASGNALAWSGTFYRRVRLASDNLQTRRRTSRIWSGEVELVSVIG